MAASHSSSTIVMMRQNEPRGELLELSIGTAAIFSDRSPGKATDNEDGAAVLAVDGTRSLLMVADGVGGHLAGAEAAEVALVSVVNGANGELNPDDDTAVRSAVMTGIEVANRQILDAGQGSATTIAIVELAGRTMRPYHVGDSVILVVGQRGKVKLQTVAHSPVGYAVESGLIDEVAAMHHIDRHVVSNVIGSPEMRIEVGPPLELAARDTILLGSDGLFDNMHISEIVEIIRKGPMPQVVETLVATCQSRMTNFSSVHPSKPDDLTFVIFRPRLRRTRKKPGADAPPSA